MSCLSEPLHLCATPIRSQRLIRLTIRDRQYLYSYQHTYFTRKALKRNPWEPAITNVERPGGNLETGRAKANVAAIMGKIHAINRKLAIMPELHVLNRKLANLELVLAPHHGSDKCFVCRTVASFKDSTTKTWINNYSELLETANSSDRDMILKHHEPPAITIGKYDRVNKVDLVLVTIGDFLAWKFRVYQVAPKNPTAQTARHKSRIDPRDYPWWHKNRIAPIVYPWRRKDRIAPSVYPNVCNARSPRG